MALDGREVADDGDGRVPGTAEARPGEDGLVHRVRLDPLEALGLAVLHMVRRVRAAGSREVIVATNPNFEGEGTAAYVAEALRGAVARVTRIARGLPSGGSLEHASKAIVSDAFEGRKDL